MNWLHHRLIRVTVLGAAIFIYQHLQHGSNAQIYVSFLVPVISTRVGLVTAVVNWLRMDVDQGWMWKCCWSDVDCVFRQWFLLNESFMETVQGHCDLCTAWVTMVKEICVEWTAVASSTTAHVCQWFYIIKEGFASCCFKNYCYFFPSLSFFFFFFFFLQHSFLMTNMWMWFFSIPFFVFEFSTFWWLPCLPGSAYLMLACVKLGRSPVCDEVVPSECDAWSVLFHLFPFDNLDLSTQYKAGWSWCKTKIHLTKQCWTKKKKIIICV